MAGMPTSITFTYGYISGSGGDCFYTGIWQVNQTNYSKCKNYIMEHPEATESQECSAVQPSIAACGGVGNPCCYPQSVGPIIGVSMTLLGGGTYEFWANSSIKSSSDLPGPYDASTITTSTSS